MIDGYSLIMSQTLDAVRASLAEARVRGYQKVVLDSHIAMKAAHKKYTVQVSNLLMRRWIYPKTLSRLLYLWNMS